MPNDTIERTIYKLELDGSGYIAGVESLSGSTKKLTAEQEKANAALRESEAILKQQSTFLQQTKKDLEAYTGTNDKYRQQLTKSFQGASAENLKLTEIVNKNRAAYDLATKAAQDFASVSARAANLQPAPGQGKIPTGPGATSGITSQIAGVLNVADFTKQAQIIEQTKNEFDDLRISIGLAEERMKQLNAEDEEFKALAPIVAQGKVALEQYDAAAKGAGEATGSLRSQIRQGREELVKLEQAGKGATKQYFELEKQVAKLTDEFGDQQARIKILASDTKLLDFGKGAITAATSAFQVYSAVSILVGEESEELQKKTMQLFAAMQLLQGLEQLSNLTRREGVLATLAQSGAQTVYTAVVGASTGALKAFKLALLATGIGAAIILIGFLVSKWNDLKEAEEKAGAAQKALLDINKEAVKSYADEVTHLKLLGAEYANVNVSAHRKKEIQDELQKSYPNYFKDLDTHADKEKYIAEQIDKVSQALVLQAKVQAAQNLLSAKFQELLKQQFDPTEAVDTWEAIGSRVRNVFGGLGAAGADLAKTANKNLSKAEAEYNTFSKFITDFVIKSNSELDALGGDPKAGLTKGAKIKEIENEFLRKKADLDQQLAELTRKEADDESKIRIEFAARLVKEQQAIEKLLKEKKLTKPQAAILDAEAIQINTIGLDNALRDFHKKQTDARRKLNDELHALQDKNTQDTLNLLQDEFDRRRAIIQFNEEKEIVDTIFANQRKLADFEESARLIYGKDFETNRDFLDKKALLIAAGEQKITNITLKAEQDRAALSADIFQNLLGYFTQAIAAADLVFTQDEAKAIRALADKFLAGKLSYERFQKELTKIEKDAAKVRQLNALQTEKDKLVALDNELAASKDKYTKYYKDLERQRNDQAQKVAELEIANAKSDVTEPTKKQVETVQQYAEAIGAVVQSVIQFWQAANAAESQALDRSIALQEKRVSAAQRIAERGNAQYLKAEEDRLTELNLKRENAARKQLGIDAALQASQILVGITGAIAKIATPGIGIAETIGSIAIIIGALATGYGLVKSLQGNQPKLAKGTKDVRRDGHPAGIDTIPAWLNEGEAVIPTHRNKAYHPTVSAIYDGTVPAEHLNNFVRTYHRVKGVPQPNYERIKDAAELHIGNDGRMAVLLNEQNKKLDENNDLQRQTLRAMRNMAVSASIDKNGVAIVVNEYMEQMKIDKRT